MNFACRRQDRQIRTTEISLKFSPLQVLYQWPSTDMKWYIILSSNSFTFYCVITQFNKFTNAVFSFKYCSTQRRVLSLAPLIAIRNFKQRRMAKNGQLVMLRHYMYATYTKILIVLLWGQRICDPGPLYIRAQGPSRGE